MVIVCARGKRGRLKTFTVIDLRLKTVKSFSLNTQKSGLLKPTLCVLDRVAYSVLSTVFANMQGKTMDKAEFTQVQGWFF